MKFGDENCQNQGQNSELEIKITHDDNQGLFDSLNCIGRLSNQ